MNTHLNNIRQSPPSSSSSRSYPDISESDNVTSSPGNRSSSFSISDILANNSPTTSRKRPYVCDSGIIIDRDDKVAKVDPPAANQQLLSLIQAGNLVRQSTNLSHPALLPQYQQQLPVSCYYPPLSLLHNYYPTTVATGGLLGVHKSPYGATTAPLANVPSLVTTSSSSSSGGGGGNNTGSSILLENMADLKLHSDYTNVSTGNAVVNPADYKKENEEPHPVAMPTVETTPESGHLKPPPSYIASYFSLSPLALPNGGFSPSIFLTHPGTSSVVSSQGSPEDSSRRSLLMTSTPIRKDGRPHSSPNGSSHSPIGHHDNSSMSEYSSGHDSELPLLRKPKVPRRRVKARTSLSPLLENTNPLFVPTRSLVHPTPSTLLTSYKLPHHPTTSTSNDSGIVADYHGGTNHQPLMEVTTQHQAQYNTNGPTSMYQCTPIKETLDVGYARMFGNSPVTDHLNKTGQIKSIPPWFVCSDKKSDGKRMRMTEAINKSLSENFTQKHIQLPAEWRKLAYGQTDDQKNLTRKARNFLKAKPRMLKFDNNSNTHIPAVCSK